MQPAAATKPGERITEIRIGYLRAYAPQLALSVLDVPPRDEGVAGANVAIGDNNTTGKFLGQKFTLDVTEVKPDADVVAGLQAIWSPRATAMCSPTSRPSSCCRSPISPATTAC